MAKTKLRRRDTAPVLDALDQGGPDQSTLVRQLCPCRNQLRDVDVWNQVFELAVTGGHRVRHEAAHAIGTLFLAAQTDPNWQALLAAVEPACRRALRDPAAHGEIIGQTAHQAGHDRRTKRTPNETLKAALRCLDTLTADDLAAWVNHISGTPAHAGRHAAHRAIQRLETWLTHRVTSQKRRRVQTAELLDMARRWLPELRGLSADAVTDPFAFRQARAARALRREAAACA